MIFVLDLLSLDKKFAESISNQRPYIQLVICVSDNNTKKLKLGKNVELDPEQFNKNKQEYVDELFDMDNNNTIYRNLPQGYNQYQDIITRRQDIYNPHPVTSQRVDDTYNTIKKDLLINSKYN
jgi:hypothetical protein